MSFCKSVTGPVLLLRARVMACLSEAKSMDEISGLATGWTAARAAALGGIEAKVMAVGPAGAVGCEAAPVLSGSRWGRARGRGIPFCVPEGVLRAAFSGVLSATFSLGFAAMLDGAADSAQPLRPPAMRARTATAPTPAQ